MSDFEQDIYEARFGRKMTYETAGSLRNQGDFTTQIDRFIVDTERKMLSVVQTALTDLTNDANNAKPDGRLPVRTGFLRHSAAAAVNARPRGETRGDPKGIYAFNAGQVLAIIAHLKLGDVFYFGWTAEYARYMEARNGFLEGALMKWQMFIDNAVARLR